MPVTSYPSLLSEILPMVNTSLGYSDILELGTEVLKLGDSNLQLERFPLDDYCEGKMISGIYYLTFDKEVTVEQLHNYIFEDKIYMVILEKWTRRPKSWSSGVLKFFLYYKF